MKRAKLIDWTLSENKERAKEKKNKIIDNELNDYCEGDLEVRNVEHREEHFEFGVYKLPNGGD